MAINVGESKAAPPKPTFSFGTLPSSSSSPSTSATPAAFQPADNVFKKIVEKQKSTWECSACLSANDVSKSKCVCCDQSRDVTNSATTSGASPAKSSFSVDSNAVTFIPKSTFSFGSKPDSGAAAATVSASSTFTFGNLNAKTNPPAQPIFGNLKGNETATSTTLTKTSNAESDKAKDSVHTTITTTTNTTTTPVASFSFGNPTVLPSTSNIDATPKPVNSVAADDVFKSIVNKQKVTTWECSACMTSNSNNLTKCLCCETPKNGNTTNVGANKEIGLQLGQTFSFGSPSGSTFSFGSKPDSKPSFQFGTSSNSTTQISTVTSTSSNIFGSNYKAPTFTADKPKPTVSTSQAPTPLGGFIFASGSALPTASPKASSKDEIDMGTNLNPENNKKCTVLDNVLIKPAMNGPPTDMVSKSMFSFGTNKVNQINDAPATKSIKRSNTDQADKNILTKFPATSTSTIAPFMFGQPQTTNTNANTNTNTFSAIVSPTVTTVSQQSNTVPTTQSSDFGFSMSKPSTSTFPTFTPSPFLFSTNNPVTTTVSSTFGTTAAASNSSTPVFGSNAFATPSASLGGFKAAAPTFGSATSPAFGTPSPNTAVSVN